MRTLLLITALASTLSGCAQMIAAASGPQPVGKTDGQRTLSERIEDISIEKTAAINLYKADLEYKNAHVLFMSFYSNVLIAGQVPNAKLKQQAEDTVRSMRDVKQVHNELTIRPQTNPYLNRAKDSIISAQISTTLTFTKDFPSSQVKVLVEDGVVYVMGKLTHAQADQAIGLIKATPDIRKIVKMIDYLDS